MAFDEALVEEAADEGVASLRFYQWSEPTLSLGYFQRYEERDRHAASRDAAVVRRISGGGALVHDRELTYALCLPPVHPLSRQSAMLYQNVHAALIEALSTAGIPARLHGPASAPGVEPFLCFERRSACDIVLESNPSRATPHVKVAGSAQRRRRGAILQHGALLLGSSPQAPELAGLAEQSTAVPRLSNLIDAWSTSLARRLALILEPAEAPTGRSSLARQELCEKHKCAAWVRRR
jgi:lipoate-protein ligase A